MLKIDTLDKKSFQKQCAIKIIYLFFVAILIGIDQITKYLAVSNLKGQSQITIIPNILSFTYLENPGAAFSILAENIAILIFVGIIVSLSLMAIFIMEIDLSLKGHLKCIALCLLMAGSLGNVIDRIRISHVIDFIKLDFIDFPIFNIADIYITVVIFVASVINIIQTIKRHITKDQQEKEDAF